MTKETRSLGVFLAFGNISAGIFILISGPAFMSAINFIVAGIIVKILADGWNINV